MAQTVGGADATLITLGGNGLQFVDWAIPEFVKSGGPLRHTVHKQPGGARQIDVLGTDPDPYKFSGIFIGSDAEDHMAYFQELWIAGDPVVLAYGIEARNVLITNLSFNYMSNSRIEYSVECTPILDADAITAAALRGNAPPGINGAAGIPIGP